MYKILVVEDEILIADTIARYLQKKGYEVLGTAISFEEAMAHIQQNPPELLLLDIRLNGTKSGIDIATAIKSQNLEIPFIFLTSQLDAQTLDAAKETFPAGYLSKPIQKESLYSTIEIVMHNRKHQAQTKETPSIILQSGANNHPTPIDDIFYLEADHVYVRVHLANHSILVRSSLKDLLEQLPTGQFIQTHRSYAVNLKKLSSWNRQELLVLGKIIPIGKAFKDSVFNYLDIK